MDLFPGSSPDNSWIIDDDEDDQELSAQDAEVFEICRRLWELRNSGGRNLPRPTVIEVDDEDEIVELESLVENEIFDLTQDDEVREDSPRVRRNQDIGGIGLRLSHITWNGMSLRDNVVVQINMQPNHPLRFRYLKIKAIYQTKDSQPGQTIIRGIPYIKSRHMGGLLKWRRREVAAVYDVDRDDPRDAEIQALVEVPVSEVTATRTLITTNAPYPEHNESGILVCRWKYYRWWPTGKFREAARKSMHLDYEAAMINVLPHEADEPYRVGRGNLRKGWRGESIPGGDYMPREGGHVTTPIAVDGSLPPPNSNHPRGVEARPKRRLQGQKYTFFDTFSGAGGASRGAVKAGLFPRYAVDHWDAACNSYRRNFPLTEVFEQSVAEFIEATAHRAMITDMCHFSPPCQVFSPAHTIPNEAKDIANLAALFGCEIVLKKVKPRVFTLEQTFGLMMVRFAPYFNHLINTFTMYGYSVRWKVIALAN